MYRIDGEREEKVYSGVDTSTSKTFVVGYQEGRTLVFTPEKYEAKTGELHGLNNSGQPVVIPLSDLLPPYEEAGLVWDD